ncbi:hypothetical protein FQN50_007624 [Emmonsiellopsis sp. PD_5]|nr:hypothetical protein FQN50_007624 [Emmonsiellopsis sp. PD_5]
MADGGVHIEPVHHSPRQDRPPAKKPSSADGSPTPTLTPRPTYLSTSNNSRDSKLPHQLLTQRDTIDLDDYFVGPRNLDRHSKWPAFMRVHGSVTPRMIIPLFFMACWSTLITCISIYVHPLGISSILLTVLGFVVGLALSLRSSTAYERYAEGRKYWATLMQASRTLARIIWIHSEEREGEEGKDDLLGKLTGINLVVAFSIALKHKLRFEPDFHYEDLAGLIAHLDTFAKAAHEPNAAGLPKPGMMKAVGSYLSIPFAISNPRKAIKRSQKPLGNLPLEILTHLSAYVDSIMSEGLLKLPVYQSQAAAALSTMDEVMTGAERVLNTPLPVAYTILISQITWIYVIALPFQLFPELRWITIPGSIIATYIIHGIAAICSEIENPFGNDVNDLPLDVFCNQVAADLDIITSSPPPQPGSFVHRNDNMVLFPLSRSSAPSWKERSLDDIRAALRAKATIAPSALQNGGSREKVMEAQGNNVDLA